MNEAFQAHMKKMQNRAVFSLFASIFSIVSIVFGVLFLFIPSLVAILFFAIAAICILYLMYVSRIAKKEANGAVYKPVILHAGRNISFEALVGIFENMTDKEDQRSISEDVRFFQSKKKFNLRTILYRTEAFDKKEFDAAKDRMNKKVNKESNISHRVDGRCAHKMMRLHLIYTHTLNDALYQFLSQNANRNLTRVEGIINIAVVDHQIMIPPIYGECDLAEIKRYKGMIQFIGQEIVNK